MGLLRRVSPCNDSLRGRGNLKLCQRTALWCEKGGIYMLVRGIRGAITVDKNSKEEIIEKTKQLLTTLKKENDFKIEDIVSIFFSVTPDLNTAFPAQAARELNWNKVPLFDMQEIDVPGSLSRCIRILIQINCQKTQSEIKHCYLRGAKILRKDLIKETSDQKEGEFK
jgi:chorismate mutase